MDEILCCLKEIKIQLAKQSVLLIQLFEILADDEETEANDLDGNKLLFYERDSNQPL